MYSEDLINVSAIKNGFLIAVRVPSKGKKSSDMPCCDYDMQTYSVKTVAEASSMFAKLLPKAAGQTVEDEFADAFDEASEINEKMDEESEEEM